MSVLCAAAGVEAWPITMSCEDNVASCNVCSYKLIIHSIRMGIPQCRNAAKLYTHNECDLA